MMVMMMIIIIIIIMIMIIIPHRLSSIRISFHDIPYILPIPPGLYIPLYPRKGYYCYCYCYCLLLLVLVLLVMIIFIDFGLINITLSITLIDFVDSIIIDDIVS